MRRQKIIITLFLVLACTMLATSVTSANAVKDINGNEIVPNYVTTFHYGNNQQIKLPGSFPNGGQITCKSYVNPASPCEGQGGGYLAPNTHLITPARGLWIPSMCDGIKCVTTDWKTWGYPSMIPIESTNKKYDWEYGTVYACALDDTWCSNPIGRWNSTGYSPIIKITNAPAFTPLVIHVGYYYKASDKTWQAMNVDQYLELGYG